MCAYIRLTFGSPGVKVLLEAMGLGHLASAYDGDGHTEHYMPAFGGNPDRIIRNIIVPDGEAASTVDATWWFDCEPEGQSLRVGRRTTFNARRLESTYWKGALRYKRGLVVATGLGESKDVGKQKHRYLMEGEQAFFLGALYNHFPNGRFCCAVITRDSHPRFERYHDNAFPLFLPSDRDFIESWLYDTGEKVPKHIEEYLAHPQITVPLNIAKVKVFKRGEVGEDSTHLPAD